MERSLVVSSKPKTKYRTVWNIRTAISNVYLLLRKEDPSLHGLTLKLNKMARINTMGITGNYYERDICRAEKIGMLWIIAIESSPMHCYLVDPTKIQSWTHLLESKSSWSIELSYEIGNLQ